MTISTAAAGHADPTPDDAPAEVPSAAPARAPEPSRRPRWGLAGAIYDLVVTVGFATPFTATALLALTRWAHDALGIPGARLPEFGAAATMFVALFGTVVTMWALARILNPDPRLIAIDTVGRALFALWMGWALLNGQSMTVVVFLIGEVLWFALQLSGLLRLRRR